MRGKKFKDLNSKTSKFSMMVLTGRYHCQLFGGKVFDICQQSVNGLTVYLLKVNFFYISCHLTVSSWWKLVHRNGFSFANLVKAMCW